MPQAVIDRVYRSVTLALKDKTVEERLQGLGFVPGGESSQAFLAGAKAEAAIWKKTIEDGRLAVQQPAILAARHV